MPAHPSANWGEVGVAPPEVGCLPENSARRAAPHAARRSRQDQNQNQNQNRRDTRTRTGVDLLEVWGQVRPERCSTLTASYLYWLREKKQPRRKTAEQPQARSRTFSSGTSS